MTSSLRMPEVAAQSWWRPSRCQSSLASGGRQRASRCWSMSGWRCYEASSQMTNKLQVPRSTSEHYFLDRACRLCIHVYRWYILRSSFCLIRVQMAAPEEPGRLMMKGMCLVRAEHHLLSSSQHITAG
eukprot:617440-Hanusia_phi.AAC.1